METNLYLVFWCREPKLGKTWARKTESPPLFHFPCAPERDTSKPNVSAWVAQWPRVIKKCCYAAAQTSGACQRTVCECLAKLSWVREVKKKKRRKLSVLMADYRAERQTDRVFYDHELLRAQRWAVDVSLADPAARQQPRGKHQHSGSTVHSLLNTNPPNCLRASGVYWEGEKFKLPNSQTAFNSHYGW